MNMYIIKIRLKYRYRDPILCGQAEFQREHWYGFSSNGCATFLAHFFRGGQVPFTVFCNKFHITPKYRYILPVRAIVIKA
jgi:hypothetical protein